jgi:hypothetical protein
VKCDDIESVVSWRGGEMKRVRRRCTNYRARARRLMIQGGSVNSALGYAIEQSASSGVYANRGGTWTYSSAGVLIIV